MATEHVCISAPTAGGAEPNGHYLGSRKPEAMRTSILLLAVAAAMTAQAKQLQVVVHTTDAHVVRYICQERVALGRDNAVRQVVLSNGRFDWHAVGGVAPYELIDSYKDKDGNVCITVRDAKGDIASGCGVIGNIYQEVVVNCSVYVPETAQIRREPEDIMGRGSDVAGRNEPPGPHRNAIMQAEPNREPGNTGHREITAQPVTGRQPGTSPSGVPSHRQ